MSETATRALSYVAMTRGRDTNTAYLYQRISEHDNRHATGEAPHVAQRATSHQAAIMLRAVVANDGYQMTAHGLAATAPHESLPHHVRGAMNQRKAAIRRRAMDYER